MDGWVDGRTDGWMGGWMDGWMDRKFVTKTNSKLYNNVKFNKKNI